MLGDILLAALSSFMLGMAGGYPCCCPFVGSVIPSSTDIPPGSSPPPGSTSTSSKPISFVDCNCCADETFSEYYQVEISGVVDGNSAKPCANCEDLDGAYILGPMNAGCDSPQNPIPPVCEADAQPRCYGELDLFTCTNPLFEFNEVTVRLTTDHDAGEIDCRELPSSVNPTIEWHQDQANVTGESCLWDGLVIPFEQHTGTVRCDGSGATVTVTAVPPP